MLHLPSTRCETSLGHSHLLPIVCTRAAAALQSLYRSAFAMHGICIHLALAPYSLCALSAFALHSLSTRTFVIEGGHYFGQLSQDAPTLALRLFARCRARASSSFHKAPWPVLRCLCSSMFSQIMAEVEAAARGHIQVKMLGDSSSIRYEDALQRCWSLLRSLHVIIINALRLFNRSRASRSLTKTGL